MQVTIKREIIKPVSDKIEFKMNKKCYQSQKGTFYIGEKINQKYKEIIIIDDLMREFHSRLNKKK